VASLGSILLGYDLGVISGVLPYIKKQFDLSPGEIASFSSALPFATTIGALMGGPISDRFGRRAPMIAAAVLFAIGALMIGLSPVQGGYPLMLMGRVVNGIAVGLKLQVSSVYIAEISPPQWRGLFVSFSEICINVGMLLAFVANTTLDQMDEMVGWRILMGMSAVPALILMIALVCMPESPRWLVANDRRDEAKAVLDAVLSSDAEAEACLAEITATVARKEIGTSVSELPGLFNKRTFVLGIGVAMAQQLSGVESLVVYIPTLCNTYGYTSQQNAVLLTVLFGIVKLIASVLGAVFADVYGRQPGNITGYMSIGLSCFGLSVALATFSVPGMYLCVLAYAAVFGATAGPLTWIILGEMFPLSYRSTGIAFAVIANRWTSGAMLFSFLSLADALTPPGVFGMYGVLCFVSAIFFVVCMKETKGETLEQIEADIMGK